MKRSLDKFLLILMVLILINEEANFRFVNIIAATPSCPNHGTAYMTLLDNQNRFECTDGFQLWRCEYNDDEGPCYWETTIVNPAPHNFAVTSSTAPTCTDAGVETQVCQDCGKTKTYNTAAALGHYYITYRKEPICLADGYNNLKCSRCGNTIYNVLPKLGHNLKTVINPEPTCTEEGLKKTTCTRCDYAVEEHIEPLGHTLTTVEEIAVTCTQAGLKKTTCSKCDFVEEEVIKPLSHKLIVIEDKKATCTEEGHKIEKCEVCGEEFVEKTEIIEHVYPEKWTIDKKAGLLFPGSKSKTCTRCTSKLTKKIDPVIPVPVSITTAIAVLSSAIYFLLRKIKRKIKIKAADIKEFEDKTIVMNLADEESELKYVLKKNATIKVVVADNENLSKEISDNEPDLVILEISNKRSIEEAVSLIEAANEENEDVSYSIICKDEITQEQRTMLEGLKNEEKIASFALMSDGINKVLSETIAPIYKPEFTAEDGVEKLGDLCDLLGIPLVSTITNLYLTGKDIKENLEVDGKGYDEISTIIADVAGLLGIDSVETVKDFIDNIISVKEGFEEEHGTNETKNAVSSAADIAETINDVIDDIL